MGRGLRKQFELDTAASGKEALDFVRTRGPYAVIVVDERMPEMDGFELLKHLVQDSVDSVRVMLTGNADQKTAIDALNSGQVFRFINKPCALEVLIPIIETCVKQYHLTQTETELLEGTVAGCVKMASDILGMVDPEALATGRKLRDSVRVIADKAKYGPLWELETGALLSSIGFAALPRGVVRKVRELEDLTGPESNLLKRVPLMGSDLLSEIPRLETVAKIVRYQDHPFGGPSVDPDEPAGYELPLGARLLKVLKDRLSLESEGIVKKRAHEVMRARLPIYDPVVLELCFDALGAFLVSPISKDKPVLELKVRELRCSQIPVLDIKTPEGMVLVAAGNPITPMILSTIKNYAVLGELSEPLFVQNAG